MGIFSLGGIRAPCCCGGDVTFCVTSCSFATPLVGAVISAGGLSCTTGVGGCCTIAGLSSGTYTVTVTVNGAVIDSHSRTVTAGGTTFISIPLPSNIICCTCPIPETLTLTDVIGTLTMGYFGSVGTQQFWYGCRLVSATSVLITAPGGVCTVAAPATNPVMICYLMICDPTASPAVTMERYWMFTGIGPFFIGASVDPCTSPGTTCGPLLPGACVTFDDSFGSANATTCSPFLISFTMAPAGSNHTTDPVGGNVSVSQ